MQQGENVLGVEVLYYGQGERWAMMASIRYNNRLQEFKFWLP